MEADGGLSYPGNNAGAAYGTGYCDAQCPKSLKFINGEANNMNGADFSQGGHYGSCCFEFDLWEANSMATTYVSHPCDHQHQFRCAGSECDGICDRSGCDINPYRNGNTDFFGPGRQVDSSRPFTVTTQFVTASGSDDSDLVEVRRIYVQDNIRVESPPLQYDTNALSTLSDDYCAEKTSLFYEDPTHASKGGMRAVGEALDRGVVLAISVWTDPVTNMKWLDGAFPPSENPASPGITRGPCEASDGKTSMHRLASFCNSFLCRVNRDRNASCYPNNQKH